MHPLVLEPQTLELETKRLSQMACTLWRKDFLALLGEEYTVCALSIYMTPYI